ncbi:MAG: hypothetical protein H6631_19580 [Anaerolineaceae bacterium]|nr:hypothetical protein [Anaerolineaceae bacterium]MCB9099763.1 hypothetical protein [Anaerolineales bacterium]
MSQSKKKPFLNRKETQSLLTTLKVATTAGALSLTLGGWGLLAQLESAQAAVNQPVEIAAVSTSVSAEATARPTPPPPPTQRTTIRLDVVQWVQDVQGRSVAVVRDKRGALWYVMGSDVPRLEQGQSPLVQPQLVRTTTRTRGS